MQRLLGFVRRTVDAGGTLAALVFLPGLVLTSMFDIVTRRFIQLGSTALQELTWHFFFACVMFALGSAYLGGRHVRVDILRERLPRLVRRRLETVLLLVLLIPLSVVIIWFGARMSWLSLLQDERSRAAFGLPGRWIIKSALPLGFLLLLGAACYRLFRPEDGAAPDDADRP